MYSIPSLSKEANIRPGLYRIPEDPIAQNVLIPAFRSAKSVRGAFGWFSSGWIHRLAPGLADYLNRETTSAIDFTVAPALYPSERAAVEQGAKMTSADAAELMEDVFLNGRVDSNALGRHALDCLAWMIATNRLRLRIAVPVPEAHYHPKIWLFENGLDRVLARGSGNATSRGLVGGVEHIDVDVSWESNSKLRVKDGIAMLDDWSMGRSSGISEVVDLPDALARQIIKTAPSHPPTPADYERACTQDRIGGKHNFFTTRHKERKLKIPYEIDWRNGPLRASGRSC